MKQFILGVLWLGVLVTDGVIIPALIGVLTGFGPILFLIALVVHFGVQRWIVGLGIFMAFLTELLLGLYFGSFIGTWLIIVSVWYIVVKFFSLKSSDESWSTLIPSFIFGMILCVIAIIGEWLIIRLVYESTLSFSTTYNLIISSQVFVFTGLEFVILLLVLRYISKTSPYFYDKRVSRYN